MCFFIDRLAFRSQLFYCWGTASCMEFYFYRKVDVKGGKWEGEVWVWMEGCFYRVSLCLLFWGVGVYS